MLKDPLMIWASGSFPYDELSAGEITPESSMDQVQDAPFALIEQGQWNTEKRRAWEQLRTVEKRLWIDFLLYPWTTEEIMVVLESDWDDQPLEPLATDLAALLGPELGELQLLIVELESARNGTT